MAERPIFRHLENRFGPFNPSSCTSSDDHQLLPKDIAMKHAPFLSGRPVYIAYLDVASRPCYKIRIFTWAVQVSISSRAMTLLLGYIQEGSGAFRKLGEAEKTHLRQLAILRGQCKSTRVCV